MGRRKAPAKSSGYRQVRGQGGAIPEDNGGFRIVAPGPLWYKARALLLTGQDA